MEKYELQKLRDLPIEGVAERLGLRVTRHRCLCPFHDDHHPSMSFSVRKNTFRCFVCGAHGGTIDLAMGALNKGFREAVEWLNYGEGLMVKGSWFEKPQTSDISHQTSFDASRYERFFDRPFLSDKARHFLYEERHIDPRVVRWCRLTSWRDRDGVEWLQIPYYDLKGRLVGIQNRNLCYGSGATSQGSAVPRFRFPAGSRCGIYNLPVLNRLKEGDELWITEGASDCWAMLSSGRKAIAVPSATLLTSDVVEQLSILNFQFSISYHMYPDRDEPGERLFLQLREVLPSLQHHQLPQGCKDYGEWWKASPDPSKGRGGARYKNGARG